MNRGPVNWCMRRIDTWPFSMVSKAFKVMVELVARGFNISWPLRFLILVAWRIKIEIMPYAWVVLHCEEHNLNPSYDFFSILLMAYDGDRRSDFYAVHLCVPVRVHLHTKTIGMLSVFAGRYSVFICDI